MTTQLENRLRRYGATLDCSADLKATMSELDGADEEHAPHIAQWAGQHATAARDRSSLRWATIAASLLVVGALATVAFLGARSSDPAIIDGAPATATTVTAASTDPKWTSTPAPPIVPRSGYVSVQTDSGWFVWGGWTRPTGEGSEQSANDGAYYDGVSDTWTKLPAAPISNDFQAAYGVWTGTEVIVVVAYGEPQLAAFDPATLQWRQIPVSAELRAAWPKQDDYFARGSHRFAAGKLVMFFPNTVTNGPAMLLLDPANGDWSTATPPPMTSDDLIIGVAASSDRFFIAGAGQRNSDSACSGVSTPLFTYDIAAGSWNTSFLPNGNWQPAFIAWTGAGLLAAGGQTCGSGIVTRTTSIYDPVNSSWSDLADMTDDLPYTIGEPQLSEGRVVVVGESGRPSVYYPDLDTWWSGPAVVPGRTLGDLQLAAVSGQLLTWSASPNEPQDGGSFSCCVPDPTALTLTIPTNLPQASSTPTTLTFTEPPTTTLAINRACATGTYVLVDGDTPLAVATLFDLTLDEFTAANADTAGFQAFFAGTTVTIPSAAVKECGASRSGL